MAEPKVTKEELVEYKRLDQERLELGRRVRLLEKQLEPTEHKLLELLHSLGRNFVRHGFAITLTDGQRRPKWEKAFVERLGADQAQEVINATEPSKVLRVEPVA